VKSDASSTQTLDAGSSPNVPLVRKQNKEKENLHRRILDPKPKQLRYKLDADNCNAPDGATN